MIESRLSPKKSWLLTLPQLFSRLFERVNREFELCGISYLRSSNLRTIFRTEGMASGENWDLGRPETHQREGLLDICEASDLVSSASFTIRTSSTIPEIVEWVEFV